MQKPSFCWDSSVFLAHLAAERRAEDEVAGLREVLDQVRRGSVVIVTSALANAEVLGDRATPEVREKFRALFKRPGFLRVDPNDALLELAGDIRTATRLELGKSIKTPDATFIATAIAYRSNALHTFDRGMLELSGHTCVQGLIITKPRGVQTVLQL